MADRFDRRRVLILTQLGSATAAAQLWLFWVLGVREPVWLLVPRAQLRQAVTINSLQFNIARAIGPLVAGALLLAAGPAWALFLNCVS